MTGIVRVLVVLALTVFPSVPMHSKGVKPQNEHWRQQAKSDEDVGARADELRQRAFYIADAMTSANDIGDELQAAHMRADFGALLCVHGERGKGSEVIRRSISDTVRSLLLRNDSQRDGHSMEPLELPVRLSELMNDCETSSQFSIADEVADVGIERKDSEPALGKEPDSVPDPLWGSKPSPRRLMAAEILARAAHQKAAEGKLSEAERLLSRSLDFCVTASLASVLGELADRGGAQAAARLFFKAVDQVKAKPSGSELRSLSFVMVMHLRSRAASSREANVGTSGTDRYVEAYLEAVLALVRGINSKQAGKSAYTVRMVKEALSYSGLQPSATREIEEWIAAMTGKLSPEGKAAVARSPFNPEPPERKVANLEEIAARSIDARKRDLARASIASTHISLAKFDEAVEVVSRISDRTLQRDLLDDVTYRRTSFSLARKAEARPLMEEIAKVARLPTRIKLYIQVAKASAEGDKVLAREALQDASVVALKLEGSATQSHLLLGIADAYAEFDSVRAFELLHEAVRSINKHGDQPASRWGAPWIETNSVQYDPDWRFPRRLYEDPDHYHRPYDFSFLRKLVWVDFDGVMLAASSLQDKLLQASATYEICAGILEKGKPKRKRPSSPPPD